MNARASLLRLFARCPHGQLILTLPDGAQQRFGDSAIGIRAEVAIHDDRFFGRVALGGDIGLGESYVDGQWSSPDPTAFIRWLIDNRATLTQGGNQWLLALLRRGADALERIRHRRNANTLAGSRRNIQAHYDLGNDFYELFLDPSMTYSSAYFAEPQQPLEDAQTEKYDRICRKLDLTPEDHVLEIGCGWGGFACYAAREYGCRVTGVTISPSQFDYAEDRVAREALSSRVSIQLQDYRHIKGRFSKIVSIEMIEAVGHDFLPGYFAAIDRLLAPEGLACIQVITSADQRYRSYVKESDFIRKLVFPGSHLPSVAALMEAKGESDLNLYHFESFGKHYATTLNLWRQRFLKQWPAIAKLGFDERFRRKWELYFCYCEAGFAERHINVAQAVFGRMNSQAYRFESRPFAPCLSREIAESGQTA